MTFIVSFALNAGFDIDIYVYVYLSFYSSLLDDNYFLRHLYLEFY